MRAPAFEELTVYLMYPLIRFCLRHSIKLQTLTEAAKRVYLDVAREELTREGEEVSASRLSVMTGVHRKDVMRFRDTQENSKKSPDVITRLIGQWQNDRRFCSKKGIARVLSFETANSEFADLAASVSTDLNPYTVLFELERIGAVEKSKRGLKLKTPIFIRRGRAREAFQVLSDDADDLIGCVEENVFSDEEVPNLHIRTEYDNIPLSVAGDLREWILDEGSKFQKKIRDYVSQFDRDINPRIDHEGPPIRVVLGTFSKVERLPTLEK